jgi:hypothetical protein
MAEEYWVVQKSALLGYRGDQSLLNGLCLLEYGFFFFKPFPSQTNFNMRGQIIWQLLVVNVNKII